MKKIGKRMKEILIAVAIALGVGCGSDEVNDGVSQVRQPVGVIASLLCLDYGEEEACFTTEAIAAGERLWLELASKSMDVPATGSACDFVGGFNQGAESCDRQEAMHGVHEEIEVASCVEADRGTAAWCATEGRQPSEGTILAAAANQ